MSLARRTLLAAAVLAQLTGAIDLNNPLDGCPPAAAAIATDQNIFNSTGEASFQLQGQSEAWHLALAFRDERAENTIYGLEPTRQTLSVIVSVPETFPNSEAGKQTSLCVYRLEQQNGTAANAQSSCTGIISDDCIKALNNVPASSDGSCPVPDISSACGSVKVVGSTTTPLVFNNTLCSTNATISGSDSIPDGFQNYITFASGPVNNSDDSQKSFVEYSDRILQPAPILITARFGGLANSTTNSTDSKLLCLAPSKVLQGSREAVAQSSGAATVSALLKPLLLATLVSIIMTVAL